MRMEASARVHFHIAANCLEDIVSASHLVARTLALGCKILLCGNGGSAADCQHMAAELVSCLTQDFKRPGLAAIALTTDSSILTAYANDFGYEGVFARQVEALGRPGDLLIGISTSGGSKNVLRAINIARQKEMTVMVLCGEGGSMADVADVAVRVPSRDTAIIQQAHLSVEHLVCHLAERMLFGNDETQPEKSQQLRAY